MSKAFVSGDMAPDFLVEDIAGSTVKLSQLRNRPVLLSFYRFASCPFCNLRIAQLMNNYEQYEGRLTIIAVFESSNEHLREYINNNQLPFPVIADPEGELYQRFGVTTSFLGFMMGMLRLGTLMRAMGHKNVSINPHGSPMTRIPADFLIDPHGQIVEAYYGSDISDHLPLRKIDDYLDGLTFPSASAV